MVGQWVDRQRFKRGSIKQGCGSNGGSFESASWRVRHLIVENFKMRIEKLVPELQGWEPFARSKGKFVPTTSGCYVLSTFDGDVLYVGLAKDLRRRFNEHLDNPEKKNPTEQGRATKFHWFETQDMQRVERTWINIHVDAEGRMPLLNKVYSPT